MTTSEMIARLKRMATNAGEQIYDRAQLAAKVMADKEWIAAEFRGDYDLARDALSADCFPELTKAFPLSALLTLIREFPEIEDWRKHKFSLMRLWAEHEERIANAKAAAKSNAPKQERQKAKVSDVIERDGKIKEQQAVIQAKENEIKSFRAETRAKTEMLKTEIEKVKIEKESEVELLRRDNERLRREVVRLVEEVKRARARADELEAQIAELESERQEELTHA